MTRFKNRRHSVRSLELREKNRYRMLSCKFEFVVIWKTSFFMNNEPAVLEEILSNGSVWRQIIRPRFRTIDNLFCFSWWKNDIYPRSKSSLGSRAPERVNRFFFAIQTLYRANFPTSVRSFSCDHANILEDTWQKSYWSRTWEIKLISPRPIVRYLRLLRIDLVTEFTYVCNVI